MTKNEEEFEAWILAAQTQLDEVCDELRKIGRQEITTDEALKRANAWLLAYHIGIAKQSDRLLNALK